MCLCMSRKTGFGIKQQHKSLLPMGGESSTESCILYKTTQKTPNATLALFFCCSLFHFSPFLHLFFVRVHWISKSLHNQPISREVMARANIQSTNSLKDKFKVVSMLQFVLMCEIFATVFVSLSTDFLFLIYWFARIQFHNELNIDFYHF